jgi:hypothetical protein
VKILSIYFGPEISCTYAPGYIQTFISLTLFDLSNRKPSKILPLSAVLFWQISANIYVCSSIAFFFSSFDHGTFGEVDTVVYALYVVVLSWNLKQKGLIQYYAYTNVANRIVLSFIWRKFSIVGIGEWWDELKNGQKLKLGDAHAPQEISKMYKCQSLGMPPRHPFFIGKNQVTFQNTIFLLLHALCVFSWSVNCFSFQFSLVLFAAINGWTPTNFFWRSFLAFHLPRTLRFSLLSFNECPLFLLLRLVFDFRLDLCSDLVISLYQGVFWPLVHIGFHQKSCFKKFEWCWKREKSSMQKSGTKRSLYRLRPRLLHAVLDVFLIVCLVVLL